MREGKGNGVRCNHPNGEGTCMKQEARSKKEEGRRKKAEGDGNDG